MRNECKPPPQKRQKKMIHGNCLVFYLNIPWMFNMCSYHYYSTFKTKIIKFVGWCIFYCFIPFRKVFSLHFFESSWHFEDKNNFLLVSLPVSLWLLFCNPTWKNVSTCCLGASSLRTGYVHLPIMSYIAFIMSSISWKAKCTPMKLQVMRKDTTQRRFTAYFHSISNYSLFFGSSLNAFWLWGKANSFVHLTQQNQNVRNISDLGLKVKWIPMYQTWSETFWFTVWVSIDFTQTTFVLLNYSRSYMHIVNFFIENKVELHSMGIILKLSLKAH